MSKNWRIWGRWLNTAAVSELPYGNSGLGLFNELAYVRRDAKRRQNTAFLERPTGTINPTTVVEFTYGISHNLNRSSDKFRRCDAGKDRIIDIPAAVPGRKLSLMRFPNLHGADEWRVVRSIDTKSGSFENFNTTQDFIGSISKVWGDHITKAGGYYQQELKTPNGAVFKQRNDQFTNSSSNPFDTQFEFANAITGAFNNYQQASSHTTGNYKYFKS